MSRQPSPPRGVCEDCGGSGWKRVPESSSVRRCGCGDRLRISQLLTEARIPKRYEKCDLDSYFPRNQSEKKAKANVQRFLDKYPLVDVGLLLIGPCGIGKTHLAVALLKEIISKSGDRGLFYDFRDLLREIQTSWNSVSQTSELEILGPVFEADVLVLDDLGANKPTDWVRDTIAHIITCRYNDRRLTIFTSNHLDNPSRQGTGNQPTMAPVAEEESLSDRIGVRLRSRLYEMCKVVEMHGEDFRRLVKQADYRF